jgi:hypothetical protein
MSRVAAIAILSALLAACGGEGSARASAEVPAPAAESAASEPLPPEIAQLLRQGPGGAPSDDFALDLEGDRPLPLRIVLEPPAR